MFSSRKNNPGEDVILGIQSLKQPVVAIIGGGVSGAAVAYHLVKRFGRNLPKIIVFEPRAEIGRGLAYDTEDGAYRINVPAARMSLQPSDLGEFQAWIQAHDALRDDPDAAQADGRVFPRRRVFGDYVHWLLKPLLTSGAIIHCRAAVTNVERYGSKWLIFDDQGKCTDANIVVIATTHPPPAAPAQLATPLADHPRYIADTTRPSALDVIQRQDRVLILGNGLTAADVIASLSKRGHQGAVTAISRRGLRSRGHATTAQDPYGDFITDPATTASSLLRKIRQTIDEAGGQALTWHAVIDQLRAQGHELWRALSTVERQRVVRHLRPYWDAHRFRLAPQVEAVLNAATHEGRLEMFAASVVDARVVGEEIHCHLQRRHARETFRQRFDALVVATGPAHGGILDSQPWLKGLAEKGYLKIDPTGLGLACNWSSEALGFEGQVMPTLLISGPLARGTFGELMGLPQIIGQAVQIANEIAGKLRQAAVA